METPVRKKPIAFLADPLSDLPRKVEEPSRCKMKAYSSLQYTKDLPSIRVRRHTQKILQVKALQSLILQKILCVSSMVEVWQMFSALKNFPEALDTSGNTLDLSWQICQNICQRG